MSDHKVQSIQCTSCGAPLSFHGGGHKIQSLNCQYCGAVMDAKNDFAVLAKFTEQKAPLYSPLTIGMEGEVKGVQFTVIGIISWLAHSSWWIDYQIFSPTHGYAWLSYENGHWIFMRRTRNLPSQSLWLLSTRQSVHVKEQEFHFFEKYQASITYVSGELTWVAKVGDKTMIAEAIAPPYIYEAERSDVESEYYIGEYIAADIILDSFMATDKYPPAKLHPLKPYQSNILEPLAKASKPFAFLSLIIVIILMLFMTGNQVSHNLVEAQKLQNGKVKVTYNFAINKPNRLVKLELNTRRAKSLENVSIQNQQGQNILRLGTKSTTGTNNYQIDKNIQSVSADFLVPKSGTYQLTFIESDFYSASTNYIPTVGVKIAEGYVNPYYFIYLLFISGIIVIAGFISRWLFESERWSLASGGYD